LDPSRWTPPAEAPGDFVELAAALGAHAAAGFAEKPSAEVAERFVRGGRHLWNLGLFAWPARHFLAELEAADPELRRDLERVADARLGGDEQQAGATYAALRSVAVEPLIFERAQHLAVVEAHFAWSDLGTWDDLYAARLEEEAADADGNVVDGDALLVDAGRNLVLNHGGRTVALVGVEGLAVVETPDATLVLPLAESQRVRDVVERLRAAGRLDRL